MSMKLIKNIVFITGLVFACLFSMQDADAQVPPLGDWGTIMPNVPDWPQNQNNDGKNQEQETHEDTQQPPLDDGKKETSFEKVKKLAPWSEYATDDVTAKCKDAYSASNLNEADKDLSPNTSELFSNEVLVNMKLLMVNIYDALSKPLMIGHSLMCYAKNVDYFCLGKEPFFCAVKLANLNMFFSGLLIYIVGVLMIMCVGMYFVDISFKLGFAVIFMPISIALWPFPTTKNKLGDNLSTIIRNGMLFALVSIGVALSVTLIVNSLFYSDATQEREYGIVDEESFWAAVSSQSTEDLTRLYSFVELRFLAVAFGIIFAFKILASSINDYLDYFFSDSAFGSESPMHHMGTQAVGMLKANTVDRAASFAKDVAKTQAGRAVAGIGSGIGKMSSAQGRKELAGSIKKGVGKVKQVVTHPGKTFKSVAGKVEDKTKEAVGSGVKGVVNSLLLALPWKESTRRRLEEKYDKWIDDNIAHGKLRNLAADTAAFGANTYNQLIKKKNAKFVTRDDVKGAVKESIESVKDDLKTFKNNGIKGNIKQGVVKTATLAHNIKETIGGNSDGIMSEEAMRAKLHNIKEDINDKYVKPATAIAEIYTQPLTDKVGEFAYKTQEFAQNAVDDFKQDVQDLKKGAKEKWEKFSNTELAKKTKQAWQESDKAPITLQPSALLKAPFKGAKGAAKGTYKHLTSMESWVEDIAKLADGWEKLQKAKEDKVILKKTGDIVLRKGVAILGKTAKGTKKEFQKAAEGTASVLGGILKNFGESMQDNGGNSGGGFVSWDRIREDEEDNKQRAQEAKNYYSSLADKFENDK